MDKLLNPLNKYRMTSQQKHTLDPVDNHIAYRLKNWQASMQLPSTRAKVRLLASAALYRVHSSGGLKPWRLLFQYIYNFLGYISYIIAYERPDHDLEMGFKVQFFSTSAREQIMRIYTARMAFLSLIG